MATHIKCGNSLIDDPKVAGEKAFKWNDEFKDVMSKGGFDVILGNPPYEVLSEKEAGIKQVDKLISYFKNDEVLKSAIKGKTNLYKLFICKGLDLTKENGMFSFIVPMALLGDNQSSTVRQYIFNNGSLIFIECFPQKDDPNNRVFKEAKLSTAIFSILKKTTNNQFYVRTHHGKYIEAKIKDSLKINKNEILSFDNKFLAIP